MKTSIVFSLLLALAGSATAQRHKIGEVNAEKPDGQLLQQIGQEADAAKKLELEQKFVAEYPKHEAAGWVWEQMQAAYAKAGQFDKAIEAGEKLLALDPDDLEAAHQNLKAAEAKKDLDLIRKWSGETSKNALKVVASPQPKEAEEVDDWKKAVDYAKQVNTYTEYSLYAAALQTADPKKKIELIETLQQRNPKSEYLAKVQQQQFLAYQQAGDTAKAVALAEQVLATDQSSEDMLLVVAQNYFQNKKNLDKVQAYTAKIVELVATRPKPEGVADADWTRRNQTILGVAHYLDGTVSFNQNKFAVADKALRAALPLTESNPLMKAEVLFMLGLSNYKMDKIQEAADFNRQCAAIKSPYQAKAAQNLAAIRQQYKGLK